MMGILTLYTNYVEKGIFAVVTQKIGNKKPIVWQTSSYLKKYDDGYDLVLYMQDGGKVTEAHSKKSVANFIDLNGCVVHEIVESEVTKLHDKISIEKKDK